MQVKKFQKVLKQLNKTTSILIMTVLINGIANAQMKIAVLDFKAGVGVEQGDVDGISAIFGTYFIDPSKFTLVERTQIDRVIKEQGFQYSTLTNQQMVKIGQILSIQKMVVGDVNIVSGQYNVDVRVVDVETGAINATEGATWTKGTSYRELMKSIANALMTKMIQLPQQSSPNSYQNTSPNIVILYNYLRVFPEDLGYFSSYPRNIIKAINDDVSYGYNTWRLPTEEEMALVNNNKGKVQGLSSAEYMTLDKNNSGRIRLVTNRETAESRQETVNEYLKRFPFENIFDRNIRSHSDSLKAMLTHTLNYLSLHPKTFASLYFNVAETYFELAKISLEREIITNAIYNLKQALDIQPDYDEAFCFLSYLYYQDYTQFGNSQGKELALKNAKLAAKFGNESCMDLYNSIIGEDEQFNRYFALDEMDLRKKYRGVREVDEFQNVLDEMRYSYNEKLEVFRREKDNLSPAIKKIKSDELEYIKTRMVEFYQQAQKDLDEIRRNRGY